MKNQVSLAVTLAAAVFIAGCTCNEPSPQGGDKQSGPIESPSAGAILQKDLLAAPAVHVMPKGCVSSDPKVVEEGKIFFNELNNKSGKFAQYGKDQEFGNCVACHQIEKANGYGNIGPDLSNYHENFIKSGGRTTEFVYQKIADARIDNPETVMTINLTTKLLTEQQVCSIVSYIVSDKK